MNNRPIENYFQRKIPKLINIAIDGPAASGKSTTAKIIADRLGLLYVDTGAMYRAITYKILKLNLDIHNEDLISLELQNIQMDMKNGKEGFQLFLNNIDISKEIRMPEVSSFVSEVSVLKPVRQKLSALQRELGMSNDSILDGRDIGTVVLPHAFLKIYMICSIEARAQRRWLEMKNKNIEISLEEIRKDIEKRDRIDSSRSISPLSKANDAIEIDTSNMTIETQVNEIISLLKEKVLSL